MRRRRVDADVDQHDHLRVRRAGHHRDAARPAGERRVDRRPAVLGAAAGVVGDGLRAGRRVLAVRHGYPRREDGSSALPAFPGWYAVLRSFVGEVPGLMVIAIILVCVAKGIATATEAAAIAVVYSLVLTAVVGR